jgi:hypothetical protein
MLLATRKTVGVPEVKSINCIHGWMIAGFRRETDDNCALLGYYATSSGNFLPTFRDKL